MKKILSLCLALALYCSSGAQTTAADFVKNDCAGASHHLFAELDSGYVVLMDFVMFNCLPCTTATDALKNIHAQFEASHPGKVRFYSMGFLNYMSCPMMNAWKTEFNYTHTVFAGESSQVNYYGGMGMPTIVVLGGLASHKVYYNHQGYSTAENTPIVNAISQAISESTTTGTQQAPAGDLFQVAPNPFGDILQLNLQTTEATQVVLTGPDGREVLRQAIAPGQKKLVLTLPASQLPAGFYFVYLLDENRPLAVRKVVKQ